MADICGKLQALVEAGSDRGRPELQTAYALESVLDEVCFIVGPPLSVGEPGAMQNVGAHLLAIAVGPAVLMLKVMASSRAGSLPQWGYVLG